MLSKKILDYMSSHHHSIYSRMTIHISDISPTSIKTIQDLNIFSSHDGRVCYEILDAASPKFPTIPDFIYHTYLVDSFPQNIIGLQITVSALKLGYKQKSRLMQN